MLITASQNRGGTRHLQSCRDSYRTRGEAHGRGVALQLNYFLDHGGVTVAQDGTFTVDTAKIRQNVIDLTRDIMTMQANADYAAAKQMVEKLAVNRPPVQAILDKLKDVPVDIEPRFVTANQLLSQR
jgi:hypothetical protein